MDLQPIAIVLQFVDPTRPKRRLLGDDWLTRMKKAAGALRGRPRELRHNIRDGILREQERSNSASVISGPRPLVSPETDPRGCWGQVCWPFLLAD